MPRSLPQYVDVDLELDQYDADPALRDVVARKLGVDASALPPMVLRRRAIDARRGRVRFHLTVELGAEDLDGTADDGPGKLPECDPSRVVIVGDGPAGMFCANELARHGIAATVLDRGKRVQPRRRDLKLLNQKGRVDPDSNYCFGEGGAGTYSDGKLYTRAHKRGDVADVLRIFVQHGAPREILVDARPHIGSNRLPRVIDAFRAHLEAAGVRFRFETRVVGLDVQPDAGGRRVTGVRTASGDVIDASHVVLATGHSARDVYRWLSELGVAMTPKPFAVGVRIEHPQPLINSIQYGRSAGHPRLPAASYRLAAEPSGSRVFSFCMCPGGWIVPASTSEGELVVNGMSLSRRDSPFANSGMVVGVGVDDLARAGYGVGPLAGVELQRAVEKAGFAAGGGELCAPAQRVTDFLERRDSSSLPSSSYVPGITVGDLAQVLDASGLPLAAALRDAIRIFGRKMRGYVTDDAVLVGVESRTSAPVRVERLEGTLQSTTLANLYPCGEGAGYAGGIMSAAMDGIRVARAVATQVGHAATISR